MASQVEICNRALTKLGSSNPIIDLFDDTRNGRALNRVYETTRDLELRSHPWTFALGRAQIPALTTAPAFGWARAFHRPADCLRLIEVGQWYYLYEGEAGFELEGSNILTDEAAPLDIRYVKKITNTGLYDALFVEALSCRLALDISLEVTGSESKKEQLWNEHKAAIAEARRINAIEKPPQQPSRGSWYHALHHRAG